MRPFCLASWPGAKRATAPRRVPIGVSGGPGALGAFFATGLVGQHEVEETGKDGGPG
jgi:hypothetical protein